MASPTYDTLRYLWGWARGGKLPEWSGPDRPGDPVGSGGPGGGSGLLIPGVRTEDLVIGDGPGAIRARRYARSRRFARGILRAPASRSRPAPGWVLLHGVTRPGPDHPAIVRFAAALARAGGEVLVPDIPAWRRLELEPAPAQAALERAAAHMCADPRVLPGGVILVGLSFGCPQALRVGARLAGSGRVRGVTGFGSYCSLPNTVRFGLTGQYQWRGRTQYLRPDPYGRWVVASNYLHHIPGYGGTEDVSQALRQLALLAGDRGIMSWDPSYDGVKDELMASVSGENRDLFRLFAPPADQEPDPGAANEIAPLLADAGRATHPHLELTRSPGGGHQSGCDAPPPPVRLIHGRHDHLIPFTETLALERGLRKRTDVAATVTGLFAHSGESGKSAARLPEAIRFFAALRGVMSLRSP